MRTLKYLTLVLWLTGIAAETDDNLAGVGVVLGVDGQHIIIRKILPDSPAASQPDLHIGDRITAIAQDKDAAVQVEDGNLRKALGLLRGAKGTTVRLTIMPSGQDNSHVRVVSFVRAELKELAGSGDGVLPTNGTKAPDIEMVRLADKAPERLSDYSDKIIVVEFRATWCGPCQPKMADLQQYYGQYPHWRSNVVLIAASVDDTEDIAAKHLKAKGWDRTHNVWVGTHAKKAYHIAMEFPQHTSLTGKEGLWRLTPWTLRRLLTMSVKEGRLLEPNDSGRLAEPTQRSEPAVALVLLARYQWRGVADAARWT